MIRTRRDWEKFTQRGTDGSQVHLILADWKEEQDKMVKSLTSIRDTARTGLPPVVLNMTQAQWNDHRLIAISSALSHLLDEL